MIDATAGGGGHSAILLELGHTVIAVDRDPVARDRVAARFAGNPHFRVESGDFRSLERLALVDGFPVCDGLLADLGLSSDQLANAGRGFSFNSDDPPDMRMDPGLPESAGDLLARVTPAALVAILRDFGEEPRAPRIARSLAGRRFGTCRELAETVATASGYHASRVHPATRTFQALRIAVNDELGQLRALLEAAPRLVRPNGVIAIISFHSLEDRLVKRTFAEWLGICRCPPGFPVCRCGVIPCAKPLWKGFKSVDDREGTTNPRARSARIRAMVRV